MEHKKTVKVKFCDFWDDFDEHHNEYMDILQEHYNVEISDQPDFLFYSCFGREFVEYDCVKIFVNLENIIPNFNECDYAEGFDYINFGDRYFRKLYEIPSPEICNREAVTAELCNRRFCNFIYSNSFSGEGVFLRQEFCKKLMEYKHVDCPGAILHNMDAGDELAPREGNWASSKVEFLKKYKFTIAFENSRSNGYTTEKLTHPLQSFSIPIYWGNPLVTRDFNPKAFINCNDYDNDFAAVIERIKELDNDPEKYLAMLRENPMQPDFDFGLREQHKQWILHIIEKGNKPFSKDPRDWKGQPFRIEIRKLKKDIAALQAENAALKTENNENRTLRRQYDTLKNSIGDGLMVKPFKKVSGNWLHKKVETERYVKTYICGVCIRKRPVNLCKYIDDGLRELEKRLKLFISNQH